MSAMPEEQRPQEDAAAVDYAMAIEQLNCFYGTKLAVKDVSFNVVAHTVTAMIGPSGCGKSTVLRALNRMHEVIPGAHAEGKVLLQGEDIYDSSAEPVQVRRRVGMVFQR